MATLLDARTSQNASYANAIAIPILVINTPQLFGQVGLVMKDYTSGDVRVTFTGTVAVQLPLALVGVTITVVRGTQPTDTLVYSSISTYNINVLAPQLITFSGADRVTTAPAVTSQLTYTAFVSSNLLGTIRVGPESFSATAYSE